MIIFSLQLRLCIIDCEPQKCERRKKETKLNARDRTVKLDECDKKKK